MTTLLFRSIVPIAAALVLAACAVPPKPEQPRVRDDVPLAGLDVPAGGAWPAADWWKHFGDNQLDALEQRALGAAPSINEAQKRFNASLAAVEVARAQGGLSGQFNTQVQRQRLSENGLIPPQFLGFTWYNQGDINVQAQYDFDFWGKNRAGVAAAVDDAHAAEADRSAATLTLTTAIADTYYAWQADQARLALAERLVKAFERNRHIASRRVAQGVDYPDTLQRAETSLDDAREMRAAYAGSARIRVAALAALLGIAPAAMPTLEPRPLPSIDARLPDGIGIDLIARRPEIAARRWQVEAAMQRVEQSRAAFYPDISLGAMVGLQSLDLDKLFDFGSRTAGIGPALHLPIFGRAGLRAAYGVSQAQLDSAAAQYDSAVVDAARDVATQALGLQQAAARRGERARQLGATQALADSAAARVRRGVSDERSLLSVQAEVLQQRDALAVLDAQAVSTEIALIKALGGGYERAGDDGVAQRDAAPERSSSSVNKASQR